MQQHRLDPCVRQNAQHAPMEAARPARSVLGLVHRGARAHRSPGRSLRCRLLHIAEQRVRVAADDDVHAAERCGHRPNKEIVTQQEADTSSSQTSRAVKAVKNGIYAEKPAR